MCQSLVKNFISFPFKKLCFVFVDKFVDKIRYRNDKPNSNVGIIDEPFFIQILSNFEPKRD